MYNYYYVKLQVSTYSYLGIGTLHEKIQSTPFLFLWTLHRSDFPYNISKGRRNNKYNVIYGVRTTWISTVVFPFSFLHFVSRGRTNIKRLSRGRYRYLGILIGHAHHTPPSIYLLIAINVWTGCSKHRNGHDGYMDRGGPTHSGTPPMDDIVTTAS